MDNQNTNSMPVQPMTDAQDIEKNKMLAIIAYLGILFIIPLLAAKDSKFAKFHANQGAIVFILGFAIGFFNIISGMILPDFVGCLTLPLYFVPLIFTVLGILNAANGKMERLPVIGNIDLIK